MNGILYRIFNLINSKSYIGKTYQGFYTRLNQHISDANRYSHRPLYRAFNKYGIESFSAEILGEYPEGLLEELEVEYIIRYKSFGNSGYNATSGGDGSRYLSITKEELISAYSDIKTVRGVAKLFHIDEGYCGKLFKAYNIELLTKTELSLERQKQILLSTGRVFDNTKECAEWFIESGLVSNNTKPKSIEQSISKVCRGVRPQYKGYKMQYI